MDPSWATTWQPNEEVQAAAWAASKLSDADVGHAAAVLARQLCVAAGQVVHLTVALADSRVRLTVRTEQLIDETAVVAWQEQAAVVAQRCGTQGATELWAELDRRPVEPEGAS